jgi:glycosyltransferase involved in cell wall biosynthesis
MKILYFRADYKQISHGGSVTHSRGIIKALRKKHDVFVVSFLESLKPDVLLRRRETFIGNILESFRLWYYALRFNPDYIYARYTWYSIALLPFKYILEWNGSDRWIQREWRNKWYSFIISPFEWLILHKAHRVVCVSRQLADTLPVKSLVVQNGVDTDVFNPNIKPFSRRSLGVINGKLLVGWVGTFDRWHGIDLLIEAVNLDTSTHWVMCGAGHERNRFMRSVGSNVTMVLSLPHENIPRLLAACDVFVNASQNNPDGTEFFGSPTKMFEYLAMGKPVFSTPYGQPGEIIPKEFQFTTAKELIAKIRMNHFPIVNVFTWDDAIQNIMEGL